MIRFRFVLITIIFVLFASFQFGGCDESNFEGMVEILFYDQQLSMESKDQIMAAVFKFMSTQRDKLLKDPDYCQAVFKKFKKNQELCLLQSGFYVWSRKLRDESISQIIKQSKQFLFETKTLIFNNSFFCLILRWQSSIGPFNR